MPEIARILAALAEAPSQPAALATLVRVEGSSYRRPGARLLLRADGSRLGSISGGCLEDDLVQRAQAVLASFRPASATYDTTTENDLVWGLGVGCRGVVQVFVEPLAVERPRWVGVLRENLRARRATSLSVVHGGPGPLGTRLADGDSAAPEGIVFHETIAAPPAVVIFGAGDDAQPVVRLAKEIGWHVTVADSRAAYATAERFPSADAVRAEPAAASTDAGRFDPNTFAVVMTHRYAEDRELLRRLLPRSLGYLGVLGPRVRTDRLLAELRADGLAPEGAGQAGLFAPVGLDLGGQTPETVALAIVAELQSRHAGRTPIHLRERVEPIHG